VFRYNDENANAITSHRRPKPTANSSSSNKIIIAADASMEDAEEA
jgi:hypothetical protein